MANNLYTTGQKVEDAENLNQAIKSAILELQKEFPNQKIEALNWDEHYVAIPLELEADLPTRGPVGNIDIREREPIYFLLHRQNYPYKAPSVWSNRHDFPAAHLPHLNPTVRGRASNFCLHRGNFDNWFSEHTIVDLVHRVQGWLRDAASDRLIRNEDGFEPMRLDQGRIIGYSIYEPSVLTELIYREWQKNGGKTGFSFLWYQLLKNPSKEPLIGTGNYAIRLLCPVSTEVITEPLELSQKINNFHTEENRLERMLFGVLVWPSKTDICRKYFVDLPYNLAELLKWAEGLGIPLNDALQHYLSESLQLLGGVPVSLVVPRPQKVIGMQSQLELINFVIAAGNEHSPKDRKWNPDAKVWSIGHRSPLTLHRARDISFQSNDPDFGRLLFIGCGAIGSKMILHFAKSGQGNLTLVDNDELSPHNLVRHGLLHESLGANKAEALKNAIEEIFYADKTIKVDILKDSALRLFFGDKKDILDQHSWLIDATASSMILNILSQTKLPDTLACCRCEIADKGKLGFLSVEGINRNPRLDDLQVLMFDMAIENTALSRWLQSNLSVHTPAGVNLIFLKP